MSPETLTFVLNAGTVVAVGLGIYWYRKLAGSDLFSRLIAALVPLAILVSAVSLLKLALRAPHWDWNAARLMPTFAITHGYKLYYEPYTGPEMNFMYGPMAAYAYLPATLAQTPTAAVLAASVIGLVCFFGPVLWLLLQQASGLRGKLFAGGAFVCFFFFSMESSPLSYSGFSVHADAPAIGLCAAACAVLGLRKRPDSTLIFIISGLLACLAVWTKQTMVPILPGLIVYVWLSDGRRCALRYTSCIFIVGICVSLVFLALNDARALYFNMFTKHLHHPLNHPTTGQRAQGPVDHLLFLIASAQLFLHFALVPLIAVIAYGAHQWRSASGKGLERWSRCVSQNRWLLPTIVGFAMIITAIPCRIGVGGDSNDQSPAVYFLLIGTVLAMVRCASDSDGPDARVLQPGAKLLLLILLASFIFLRFTPPSEAVDALKVLPYNAEEATYQVAKKQPGVFYFPGNPLASLLAEGKLYHFLMGLHERTMDGYPPSYEYFWEYMPANTQVILVPNPAWMKDYVEEFHPYLQQFSPPSRDPSGWYVYRRVR